jgi:hypothetical protein
MPVFVIRQVVTHPLVPEALVQEKTLVGRDLGHAIECVRVPNEPMVTEMVRRQLRKKYWAEIMRPGGKQLYIEIIEEMKA